jgi:hypothetical protein
MLASVTETQLVVRCEEDLVEGGTLQDRWVPKDIGNSKEVFSHGV